MQEVDISQKLKVQMFVYNEAFQKFILGSIKSNDAIGNYSSNANTSNPDLIGSSWLSGLNDHTSRC